MTILVSLYIWIIGGLYFLSLCFLTLALSFFMSSKTFDPLLKFLLRGLFKIIFVKVRVKGLENVQVGKNYLFMANHSSLFDIPLLEGYIPTFVRGVEALRQFKWPVYGWVIRRLGNIPIDRKNIHASIRSIKKAETFLQNGRSIVLLPEGHRTRNGKLQAFKKLPFHLAKQAGVPILPAGLSGLFELKNTGSWKIHPGPIQIQFGSPISPDTIQSLSIEELRDCTHKEIDKLIIPLSPQNT